MAQKMLLCLILNVNSKIFVFSIPFISPAYLIFSLHFSSVFFLFLISWFSWFPLRLSSPFIYTYTYILAVKEKKNSRSICFVTGQNPVPGEKQAVQYDWNNQKRSP